MKTYTARPKDIERNWWVVDAEGLVLGRVAAEIAKVLRGKHKATYTPHLDCGDNVVVINADKVHLTGKKLTNRSYFRHTGYPGGIKETTPVKILSGDHPQRLVQQAVQRMISRNPLGRQQLRKLHVYAGSEHPHAAQKPVELKLAERNLKNKKDR